MVYKFYDGPFVDKSWAEWRQCVEYENKDDLICWSTQYKRTDVLFVKYLIMRTVSHIIRSHAGVGSSDGHVHDFMVMFTLDENFPWPSSDEEIPLMRTYIKCIWCHHRVLPNFDEFLADFNEERRVCDVGAGTSTAKNANKGKNKRFKVDEN